ncbi:TIGR00730 family Rossman fold protein, partial [Fischerella thermalis CCMEE 5319]
GKDYWGGLVEWLKKVVLYEKNINPEDLNLFHLVDEPSEAIKVIDEFYAKYLLRPNF